VRDNRFDLEEFFFAVVTTNDGETQSAVGFEQSRTDPFALQLGRISREERPVVT
jgi:hypothetical protein